MSDSLESIDQPVPDSPQSIEDTIKALMAPMQAQLSRFKEENDSLREKLNEVLATPHGGNLQGVDFPVNPDAARSVVIATRPVLDRPDLYGAKPIVDSSALIRNDASPLSGKNR